jgi:hypothetical protein
MCRAIGLLLVEQIAARERMARAAQYSHYVPEVGEQSVALQHLVDALGEPQ